MSNISSNVRLLLIFSVLLCGCNTSRQFSINNRLNDAASSVVSIDSDSPVYESGNTEKQILDVTADSQVQALKYNENQNHHVLDDTQQSTIKLTSSTNDETESVQLQWNLEKLESLALSNNPAIKQAEADAYKVGGFRTQVGLKPNPIVGYNGTQLADEGTDQHTVFVEQEIVRGNKLGISRSVLSYEMQSQQWEAEAQRYRVLTDLRQLYFEALAAKKKMNLIADFSVVAKRGVEIANLRNQSKEGNLPELLQAEIFNNQLELQNDQHAQEYVGIWGRIEALAGIKAELPVGLIGELPTKPELDEPAIWLTKAISSSPVLNAARVRVTRAQVNMNLQQSLTTPNISYSLAAGIDQGTNSGLINTQVGVPLAIHNMNQGNKTAAYGEFCRASQEVKRIEADIKSRMATVMQNYASAKMAVVMSTENMVPKAEKSLKIAEAAYAAGEFSFLEVMVSRKTYYELKLQQIDAQLKLAVAEVNLKGMGLTGGLQSARESEIDSSVRDQILGGR